MTRKHYEAVARIIRDTYEQNEGHASGTIAHIAERFAEVAQADNARFNTARFLEACGIVEGEWVI